MGEGERVCKQRARAQLFATKSRIEMTKMQHKNFFVLILLIFALAIAACEQVIQGGIRKEITNFDECAKAGYPIGESYPRQCFLPGPNGKSFVEEIESKEPEKTIETEKGELKL